ncbi:hypothetical protein QQS21_002462 [Conoideocrella luteorostrata]|uniref:gluconokinase n=1 Tax=Conoideocrella luteorostrata TaxID=1105319 RepID=A0AAJ0CZ74_9HYPO|nr:hypothetical protein QQS21_002462 [Conoideocrella luteorostrata]
MCSHNQQPGVPDQSVVYQPTAKSSLAPYTSAIHDTSPIRTIDGLVHQRAALHPDAQIVSYPRQGVAYVHYTLKQLDVFAWRVAKLYARDLPSRKDSHQKPRVIALLGPSNLEYLISLLALTKLGHSVLFLSTRISAAAIESLMQTTSANAIIGTGRFLATAAEVQKTIPYLQVLEMSDRSIFEYPIEAHGNTQLDYCLDPGIETNNTAFIIHSSGSTGHPKPIHQTHKSCLANYSFSMEMKAFITLPLFHNHGICNLFRAVYSLHAIHFYNAELPLTRDYLLEILSQTKFEVFYGVPYALKLLSETSSGIKGLRDLKIVMYGGSACPDDLGNLLVDNGVNLVSHYGATEVGQLMTSFRNEGDKAWNYVRESEKLSPFLKWRPHGPNLYECVVMDGWPSKVQANQADGSYATKDLFEPHPSIPKAWKYIARLDDTIVLVNGEKFSPTALEGAVRSNMSVTEAVVFGSGRPYLGLLVVPAPSMDGKSDSQILDVIWPVVEFANKKSEAFAQISKSMIKLLPHSCEYPRTDKGSIIRSAFYKVYATKIQQAYDAAEGFSASHMDDLPLLDLEDLRLFIRKLAEARLPHVRKLDDRDDFFTLGLDSLQAIQMRSDIIKTIKVGSKGLGQNVVFEHPSVNMLSSFLLSLHSAQEADKEVSMKDEMEALIEKYKRIRTSSISKPSKIIVTGATGSLGAHVVAQLANQDNISHIYCLVRARDASKALQRVKASMIRRQLYHQLSLTARRKIHAFPSDLEQADLGLSRQNYQEMTDRLTAIIHCAWSVNFNMQLSSFEKGNIAGVSNLLALCRSAHPPATMNFCSSVSTCTNATQSPIPERVADIEWAQGMGYAQSKTVAEHLCAKAVDQGVTTRVLRVGQIVGDTKHGIWNSQEAIPMMMQTAVTVGALPKLNETPSWLPVDVVAKAVSEITLSDAGSIVANVTNPCTFNWNKELLPALRFAGLNFDEVEPKEWVRRLRTSNPDPIANPPIKLLDFFASKYDKEEFERHQSKPFATGIACSLSPSLTTSVVLGQALVDKFVGHFLRKSWASEYEKPLGTAIVISGPCGAGKSSIGAALAQKLAAPLVEDDDLHTEEPVASMRSGVATTEIDHANWPDRILARLIKAVAVLRHARVVAGCSALTVASRSCIRDNLRRNSINVVFIDLQTDRDVLISRLTRREDHHVRADEVNGQGQADLHQSAAEQEVDVVPIDSAATQDAIVDEISWILDLLEGAP